MKNSSRPMIIDSCCGTGLSSIQLAEGYPDHKIIGIDKSYARLSRAQKTPPNCILVRGDVVDLSRIIAASSMPVARHYVLYPNPYPKISHVKRRFHGHAIWPTLVKLAPYFELRCNWLIYAQEVVIALKELGQEPSIALNTSLDPLTLFEKKYMNTGCETYVIKNFFNIENFEQKLYGVMG